MKILNDLIQGSDQWFTERIGSIGGSSIASVVAGGKGKMRKNLLYRLAGEMLSGQKYEGYTNAHLERGIEQEAAARSLYEIITEASVLQVGLVKENEFKHYSPDGLVGDDGIIEIKCVIPSVHIETIITEKISGDYNKQIQWGLSVCQRAWVDFVSYSPLVTDQPIWVKRCGPDTELIADLHEGADKFIEELKTIVLRIKRMDNKEMVA